MSKRNFILLIIVLVIIILAVLAFMFFSGNKGETISDEGGTNFFAKFNPFGKNNNQEEDTNSDEEGTTDTTPTLPTEGLRLRKVSTMPVAGYGIFSKERFKELPMPEDTTGTEFDEEEDSTPILDDSKTVLPTKSITPPSTEFATALRYVAKETGYVYQTFADKIEERRFSSTYIPKVHEAFFGNKGESVVMRYLKSDDRTIDTFLGTLPKEVLGGDTSDTNELKGSFLPENVTNISLSPDLFNIFYTLNTGNSFIGTTAGIVGDKKNQIFSSAFTEWLTEWPNQKIITLTTKPSSGIPGYMYFLDSTKKVTSRVLSDIKGLTTLTSPTGKFVLYGNDVLEMSIVNVTSKNITNVPIKGLPEKCVWGKNDLAIYCLAPGYVSNGKYPDIWYRGEISFSDQIWKFDSISGATEIILDPLIVEGGEDIDGIRLMLDTNENYLFFMNKKDSYLWEFKLN